MKVAAHRDTLTVRLDGVFDFHTCATLPAALGPVLERGIKTIRLDGSGLRFCDTGAVNTLLRLREAAVRRDIALRLCRPSKVLEEIIDLTETRPVLLPCPGTRSCQCSARPAAPHARSRG
ncbi:STAS domain-containing protein [Streptacidiphilus monticola]